MDFAALSQFFVPVVVLACLGVGYIIKNASFCKWIPNNDIPVILATIGAIVNAIVNGISVDTIVYGAVMGLASTGMHQAFKQYVENPKNKEVVEE